MDLAQSINQALSREEAADQHACMQVQSGQMDREVAGGKCILPVKLAPEFRFAICLPCLRSSPLRHYVLQMPKTGRIYSGTLRADRSLGGLFLRDETNKTNEICLCTVTNSCTIVPP